MKQIDLVFNQSLPDGAAPIDLVFGRTSEIVDEILGEIIASADDCVGLFGVSPVWDASIAGVNPSAASQLYISPIWALSIEGIDPDVTTAIEADYDLNVHRGPRIANAAKWGTGLGLEFKLDIGYLIDEPVNMASTAYWQKAKSLGLDVRNDFDQPKPMPIFKQTVWQLARSINRQSKTLYEMPNPTHQLKDAFWGQGKAVDLLLDSAYDAPPPTPFWMETNWHKARPLNRVIKHTSTAARNLDLWLETFWGLGLTRYAPGIWVEPGKPKPPPEGGFFGPVDLTFICDWLPCNINMVFGGPCCGSQTIPQIPIETTYFMTNDVTLLRESDQLELPVFSASASLDPGTWAWSFKVTTHESARRYIGHHERLRLIINGHHFVWITNDPDCDLSFGSARLITISGNSQQAELDIEPLAGVLTQPITSRQLAELALENSGYTLDWRLSDWLIPAGAYSWEPTTRINKIVNILESVNGQLWSHPSDKKLIAVSKYPLTPWEWEASPTRFIPEDILEGLSEQWRDDEVINGVIVTGETMGVTARIKRAGTAGDKLAETIIHPLITEASAARERGLSVIAASGKWCDVSISLPVLQGQPLYEPRELVSIGGDRPCIGMVGAIGINAQLKNDALVVRQNLIVERNK